MPLNNTAPSYVDHIRDLYGGNYKKIVAKDYQKAKDIINALVPIATGLFDSQEYKNILSNYRLYNNDIDLDDLREVCNPFGVDEDNVTFYENIIPINPGTSKIDALVGEEIKRREIPKAILINSKGIAYRDREIQKDYEQSAQNALELILEEETARMQGASEQEIQEIQRKYEGMIMPKDIDETKFLSEKEILGNDIIKYAKHQFNLPRMKNKGFKHALLSDMEFAYVGLEHGKPVIRLVNVPDLFYGKSENEERIEYGDYVGSRVRMTLGKVIQLYPELTQKDIDTLLDQNNLRANYGEEMPEMNKIKHPRFKTVEDRLRNQGYVGYNEGRSAYHGQYGEDLIHDDHLYNNVEVWVTHVEFRVRRKIGLLTTLDDYGNKEVVVVDESFPIPEDASSRKYRNKFKSTSTIYEWVDEFGMPLSLEWFTPTIIMEGTRIGEDVFTRVKEKPYQFIDPDNPYAIKPFGYHGLVFNAMNAKSISLMGKIRPALYLYFIVVRQIVSLLSGVNGDILAIDVDQIPRDLFEEEGWESAWAKAMSLTQKRLYVYSSSGNDQETVHTRSQPAYSIPNSSLRDMMQLAQMANWLEDVIGKTAGVSPQREGQLQQYTNASDNQQAVVASSTVTEIYYYNHNSFWENVLETYVNLFVNWAKEYLTYHTDQDEIVLNYVLSDGGISSLRVSKDKLDNAVFGLFTSSTTGGKDYIDQLTQLLLPAVQNQMDGLEEMSAILKAKYEGTSPEEMHKMISVFMNNRYERQQQQAEQQAQRDQRLIEEQNKLREDVQAHELDKITLKEDKQTDRELQLKALEIAQKAQESADNQKNT